MIQATGLLQPRTYRNRRQGRSKPGEDNCQHMGLLLNYDQYNNLNYSTRVLVDSQSRTPLNRRQGRSKPGENHRHTSILVPRVRQHLVQLRHY